MSEATKAGLRDTPGYDTLLKLLSHLGDLADQHALGKFLEYLLHKLAALREESDVPLITLQRISLEQYETFVAKLLETPNGELKLRLLVDRTSIEVFAQEGEVYMPVGVIPSDHVRSLDIFARGGAALIRSLEVCEVKSAWR